MSSPSMRMRPASGRSNPASMRKSVVLPQPEGPKSAKNSPAAMSSETPSTAAATPGRKRFTTPSMRRCERWALLICANTEKPLSPPHCGARGRNLAVRRKCDFLRPRLHLGPGAGAQALILRRHRLVEEKASTHLGRGIDVGVVADIVIDELGRKRVG